MGGASSRNAVTNAINQIANVYNTSTQDCTTKSSNVINIVSKNNCGGDIVISGIKTDQISALDIKCLQENAATNNIDQNLKSIIDQQAEAIAQQFQLGSADTENLVNQFITVATTIKNNFNQAINANLSNVVNVPSEILDCAEKNSGGNIIIKDSEFKQDIAATLNAAQQSESINAIKQTLETALAQKAKAKVEPLFGGLALIVIAFVIILGLILWRGTAVLTDWKALLGLFAVIVFFIGVYFLMAFILKWPPFKKPDTKAVIPPAKPPSSPTPEDPKFDLLTNTNLLYKDGKIRNLRGANKSPEVTFFVKTPNEIDCRNKCGNDNNCGAYTWVDTHSKDFYRNSCTGLKTGVNYEKTTRDAQYSGIKR